MSSVAQISDLRNQVLKAKHAYFHRGEANMSEVEYDAMGDQLRLLSPDDPVLAMVGLQKATRQCRTSQQH